MDTVDLASQIPGLRRDCLKIMSSFDSKANDPGVRDYLREYHLQEAREFWKEFERIDKKLTVEMNLLAMIRKPSNARALRLFAEMKALRDQYWSQNTSPFS